MRILFVCTGNICRSPTGEAVLRQLAARAGVDMEVASAGTSSWHEGQGADPRSLETARSHGYDLSQHRARAVRPADFSRFDRILAMDRSHLKALQAMTSGTCTAEIELFLPSYAPECGLSDVPDPYYGGDQGFESVLALLETGCRNLLSSVQNSSATHSKG